jgi:hypothetical protein
MAAKQLKEIRTSTTASQGASVPYDPLDLKTLAESMAKVVLEQPVHPLGQLSPFEGAGVYVIYYTGSYEPYKSIAKKNRSEKWEQPIYVGEAARKGGRKGGVLLEGQAGKVLFNRLKNHLDSIRNTKNLKVDDFWCRYLAIKDFFIPLCESLLIDRYTPIWNKVIDGFGNKVVGAGREKDQQKSMWDVLRPGRSGAAAQTNKKYPTDQEVLEKLRKFYAGKPVKLISTTDAVATAEKEGQD